MTQDHLIHRYHRLRKSPALRDLLQETRVTENDLIMPIFVHEGLNEKKEITSLPGVYQHTLRSLKDEINEIKACGLKAIILFGIPNHKDGYGTEAYNPKGIIQKAITQIKAQAPDLFVIADCCLCEYTDHGHCGVMGESGLQNDETLALLQKTAVSYAQAGVDCVAPSGMMDGMVSAIRSGLDAAGYPLVSVMSYAVKYASAFYGPFRDAAGSSDCFHGDRKHHQMNPSQRQEAFLEAEKDIQEGADFLMVKPASHYLDIIRDLKNTTHVPLVAYHVSGEYAMLKAAAAHHIVNEREAFTEHFISLKRSGVDLIITYYAKDFLKN